MIFAGNGYTGTGLTGHTHRDSIVRAATNSVDSTEENWLKFIFDTPETATEYEGISGFEDSGGPALFNRQGKLSIAGVSCCQLPGEKDGQPLDGGYGSTEYYTRVSSYLPWIRSQQTRFPSQVKPALFLVNKGPSQNPKTETWKEAKQWINKPDLTEHAILHAMQQKDYPLLSHWLTTHPVLKNLKIQQQPLLAYVLKWGDGPLFNQLVKLGLPLEYTGFQGQTYLSLATWQYHNDDYPALVDTLLARGADVNRQDNRGDSPLHLAGFMQSARRMTHLLSRGADINLRDHQGRTVLIDMVRKGNAELVELLIKKGADTGIRDAQNLSPLDYAKRNNNTPIQVLLTQG